MASIEESNRRLTIICKYQYFECPAFNNDWARLAMQTHQLIFRNLSYFWRTNLAVILGVATAVSVLSGALLVGDSVRGSLRDLVLRRIGQTDYVISSTGFFDESLLLRLKLHPAFTGAFHDASPMIVEEGIMTHQDNRRRASDVHVYGINEQFWSFNRLIRPPENHMEGRNVLIGSALAKELQAKRGDSLILRLEAPGEIPLEYLHGRKDRLARTIRVVVNDILTEDQLGSFALRPSQASIYAVFISVSFLQHELDRKGQMNTILVTENPTPAGIHDSDASSRGRILQKVLQDSVTLADLGLTLRANEEQGYCALESSSTLLTESQSLLARNLAPSMGLSALPILTYMANGIDLNHRRVPYSLVSGLEATLFDQLLATNIHERGTEAERARPSASLSTGQSTFDNSQSLPPLLLNTWAAEDLGALPGDKISLEYYVWQPSGLLATQRKDFALRAVVPMRGLAADQTLAPAYPGITDSDTLSDWDPPFPLDLRMIRSKDEQYWKTFRTTPKAFIPLEIASQLWGSRYGLFTSVRFYPQKSVHDLSGTLMKEDGQLQQTAELIRSRLKPLLAGTLPTFSLWPLRLEGLRASQGATDFGAYFTYFSFFLALSAVALAGLFFRFGLEQRLQEIGLLRSMGFSINQIKKVFLAEGIMISAVGGIVGIVGAWGFGELIVYGLKTWWIGAVHTKDISVYITPFPLWVGIVSGISAASVVIGLSLQKLGDSSPRSLLSGAWFTSPESRTWQRQLHSPLRNSSRPAFWTGWLFPALVGLVGLFLLVASRIGFINQMVAFFSAGMVFLIATHLALLCWLRQARQPLVNTRPPWALATLGFRNLTYRPGRSLLTIALIAAATFIIVSVDAFRHVDEPISTNLRSGTGGIALQAESLMPIVYDLSQPEGRSAMNLEVLNKPEFQPTRIFRFRLRPGDDTSCLNLYQPRNPRILAPTKEFLAERRFTFHSSLASSPEEVDNPWTLLSKTFADGAVPAIVDVNSLNYSFHLTLGQDIILSNAAGSTVRFRVVAALADSLFQREILISENNFLKLFPGQQGYRFFLIDAPPDKLASLTEVFEERLSDYGLDVRSTSDQLATFHQVENTYLSTFQSLGGLGLLLGSFGLVAVLLRNIVESRHQLALLRAIGYTSTHLMTMVSSENIILLCLGLGVGTVCAWIAIVPAILERGGQFPTYCFAWLIPSIFMTGAFSSLYAAYTALRIPLVQVLKIE